MMMMSKCACLWWRYDEAERTKEWENQGQAVSHEGVKHA